MESFVKDIVVDALEQFAFDNSDLNIRYQYIQFDRMHLVEVDPPEFYGLYEVEQFENYLAKLVSDVDLTQVVLFVKKGDEDFVIDNPELVLEALKPEKLVSVDYSENMLCGVLNNIVVENGEMVLGESNFALAA